MDNVKILAVGDFGTDEPESVMIGFNLKAIIDSSDLSIINFEGSLHKGNLISATCKAIPQSDSSPEWCVRNGFNIISLANNHTMDFGVEGLLATKKAFKEADDKISIVGAGNWSEVYSLTKIYCKGRSIGFLAATSADFSSLKCWWDDKNRTGCAWANSPEFTLSVVRAKQECDFLILLIHAGVEHLDYPLPEWRERYRELITLGADAIVASHPHVPQGFEYFNNKPIFYSLGNFHFKGTKNHDNLPPRWCESLAVCLEISDDGIKATYYPVKSDGGVVDIDSDSKSYSHVKDLSKILADDDLYLAKVNKEIDFFGQKFLSWFIAGMNVAEINHSMRGIYFLLRKLIKGKRRDAVALHQLREESTRYSIVRYLKKRVPRNL